MIGWIQLREDGLQSDLQRPTRLNLVPSRAAHWELEKEIEEKTEALRMANRHLLLDLADRMKAEIALRDHQSQLRAMFENALDGMVLLDNDRKILDANESALQLFGYSLAEMQTLRWEALVPERTNGSAERWKAFLHAGTKRGEV